MISLRLYITVPLAAIALGCAVAALAAHGGRVSIKLDVLTHFAPIYLLGGLLAVVVGLFLGRPGLAWVAAPGAVAVLASVALMAPEFLASAAPNATGGGSRLTIVQFNAWGGNPKADAAVAWILAQHPDIVVLEEGSRIGGRLVTEGGFHASCRGCLAVIYSKLPLVADNSLRHGQTVKPQVSWATYADAAGDFTVFGVHRPWPTKFVRDREETATLNAMVAARPRDRSIVVGDFNSTPWSFARRREDKALGLIRRTRGLFSWPAERVSHNRLPALFPVLPIDHVYAG
ncbi:MAG TPA: endonuclease/exonuclease/phosphatase family protein, partial [Phenylobacterium sp.]|uniref:endonuclease/exonuclease/phosphatase family protein n=1 Tax=Phenylobacterium sp. TaxID=1871053 RepID=UPI002D4A0302